METGDLTTVPLGTPTTGILIGLALLSLLVCIWMIYFYIGRIRMSAIHGRVLKDTVRDARYRELRRAHQLEEDPQDLKEQLADWQQATADLETRLNRTRESLDEEAEGDTRTELLAQVRDLEQQLVRNRATEDAVRKQLDEYQSELRRLSDEAEHYADLLVPKSLTVAGMGITGNFFIELTAILTIIFGVLILGLVGVLGTDEIAPILAAIAGYVLGKTSAPRGGETASPENEARAALDAILKNKSAKLDMSTPKESRE